MNVHFNDTRSADAPAGTLFEVITDYPSYPDFNLALIHVTVISQDDTGRSEEHTSELQSLV